jgi:hypothetical protein
MLLSAGLEVLTLVFFGLLSLSTLPFNYLSWASLVPVTSVRIDFSLNACDIC